MVGGLGCAIDVPNAKYGMIECIPPTLREKIVLNSNNQGLVVVSIPLNIS